MRLIDADNLMTEIIDSDLDHLQRDDWKEVIQIVQDAPTIQPHWILCSERLSEDRDYHEFWEFPDGAVLWCKDTGEIGVGWYYASTKNWCDLWDNGVRDVIAWMPLPKPYKEE